MRNRTRIGLLLLAVASARAAPACGRGHDPSAAESARLFQPDVLRQQVLPDQDGVVVVPVHRPA